jgi:hypothetical protein
VVELAEALREERGGPGFDSLWGPWKFLSNLIVL